MPKADVLARCEGRVSRLAEQMNFELVDLSLDKEPAGSYLRVYIDKPEGISLDDCEKYHRALAPMLEDIDYDFLEVSSPGIDRPLKRDRDFERAIGLTVEVRFFKAVNGSKQTEGVLTDFDKKEITLEVNGEAVKILRKDIALCHAQVDMSGVEEVDLSGDEGTEDIKA